jgi:hypothetical protein
MILYFAARAVRPIICFKGMALRRSSLLELLFFTILFFALRTNGCWKVVSPLKDLEWFKSRLSDGFYSFIDSLG